MKACQVWGRFARDMLEPCRQPTFLIGGTAPRQFDGARKKKKLEVAATVMQQQQEQQRPERTKHRSPEHGTPSFGTWTESIPESWSCDVSSVGNTKLCPSASPLGESWLGQTCNNGREQIGGLVSGAESSSNEPASEFSKVESVRFGFTTFHKRFNPDSLTCF